MIKKDRLRVLILDIDYDEMIEVSEVVSEEE